MELWKLFVNWNSEFTPFEANKNFEVNFNFVQQVLWSVMIIFWISPLCTEWTFRRFGRTQAHVNEREPELLPEIESKIYPRNIRTFTYNKKRKNKGDQKTQKKKYRTFTKLLTRNWEEIDYFVNIFTKNTSLWYFLSNCYTRNFNHMLTYNM